MHHALLSSTQAHGTFRAGLHIGKARVGSVRWSCTLLRDLKGAIACTALTRVCAVDRVWKELPPRHAHVSRTNDATQTHNSSKRGHSNTKDGCSTVRQPREGTHHVQLSQHGQSRF